MKTTKIEQFSGSNVYLINTLLISIFKGMRRIILVGFMGSGKTTLGKKIAQSMGIPFIDSDQEIEEHFQKSIGEIFTENGESYFRTIETEYIEALDLRDEFVLATGGGMPCFDRNMSMLNEIGTTFYLNQSPKELAHRLSHAKFPRPLIEGLSEDELLPFIEDKLSAREEYYKMATIVLDQDEQTAETIEHLTELLLQPLQKS
ncbi:MAG: shikimate kinase [Crocinitomicaceae bacterium]